MAKLIKVSSCLPGIHNLAAQGNVPHLTTAPFIRLHQLQKNKERFLKEQARLIKRLVQINKEIPFIEQELERLFRMTEQEVRPSVAAKEAVAAKKTVTKKKATPKRTVLEY